MLSGDAGFGTSASGCTGTVEELTGVRVTWSNATTGTYGQAFQSVQFCPLVQLCYHTWRATVPLVLGDNQITVTASDTTTGAANTNTITINKPALSYTASGTLSTIDQIGIGHFESGVKLHLSGDAANSIIPSSRSQAEKYEVRCLVNGDYTITPTTNNTFNYLFQPPSRNFTVVGADVSDLDFQTTAYAATGMIRDTAGNPLGCLHRKNFWRRNIQVMASRRNRHVQLRSTEWHVHSNSCSLLYFVHLHSTQSKHRG